MGTHMWDVASIHIEIAGNEPGDVATNIQPIPHPLMGTRQY